MKPAGQASTAWPHQSQAKHSTARTKKWKNA